MSFLIPKINAFYRHIIEGIQSANLQYPGMPFPKQATNATEKANEETFERTYILNTYSILTQSNMQTWTTDKNNISVVCACVCVSVCVCLCPSVRVYVCAHKEAGLQSKWSNRVQRLSSGQMLNNNFIRQQSNWLNKTHSSITEILTASSPWVFSASASGVL